MLFLLWLVLCLIAVALFLLPPAFWRRELYNRYSGSRLVACPENRQAAVVRMDAGHAASTGMHGSPDLRLCDCTRWPERAQCGQACLAQALEAEPHPPGDRKAGTKPIYHFPVLLAAFVAWCLGAIWHAQYAFRPQWLHAVGLTHVRVRELGWWTLAHLLAAAACLLFAYGVAWLLAVCHRRGVLPGVLISALLCGALVAANWHGIAGLPHELLAIEAGYAALAVLAVGSIIGGLYGRLPQPSQ